MNNHYIIEPYNAYAPARKKHWSEIAEEEAVYHKMVKESLTQQMTQTDSNRTGTGAGGIAVGNSGTAAGVFTFFDADSTNYYTLSIDGPTGFEALSISMLSSPPANVSVICLFDSDSNAFYSLAIQGTLGEEVLTIISSGLTQATPMILLNPTNGLNYNISIQGTLGNEFIAFTPV